MAVFVDGLCDWGWQIRGVRTHSCHLFTDDIDLTALHQVALCIGMRREWFQNKVRAPHYDLTPSRREAAIAAGAIPVDRKAAVRIWRVRRELLLLQVKSSVSPLEHTFERGQCMMNSSFQIFCRAREEWNAQADEFNQWDALGADEKLNILADQSCCAGDVRFFIKSGNAVRLIASEGSDWQVTRVDGGSIGKGLLCPTRSLMWCLPGSEGEALEACEAALRSKTTAHNTIKDLQ